jgi:hypothetical protein
MSKEPDPIVRKSVSLRASVWRAVEEYRDREAVVTTADAVRRLLQAALRTERRKAEK